MQNTQTQTPSTNSTQNVELRKKTNTPSGISQVLIMSPETKVFLEKACHLANTILLDKDARNVVHHHHHHGYFCSPYYSRYSGWYDRPCSVSSADNSNKSTLTGRTKKKNEMSDGASIAMLVIGLSLFAYCAYNGYNNFKEFRMKETNIKQVREIRGEMNGLRRNDQLSIDDIEKIEKIESVVKKIEAIFERSSTNAAWNLGVFSGLSASATVCVIGAATQNWPCVYGAMIIATISSLALLAKVVSSDYNNNWESHEVADRRDAKEVKDICEQLDIQPVQ